MYSHHFGSAERLHQAPAADWSDSLGHRRAMTVLGYGVAQGEGIMLLTGASGTGKSSLAARLAATIDQSRTAVVPVVADPQGEDVLRQAARAFGIAVGGRSGIALLEAIEQRLDPGARAGRRTLLVVDEAHGLPGPELDALRILSTLHAGGRPLVQILLAGRPDLRERLKRPELMALRQRIVAEYHLGDEPVSGVPALLPPVQRFTLVPQPAGPDDAQLEKTLAALKQQLAMQEEQLKRALSLLLEKAVEEGAPLPMLQISALIGKSSSYSAWTK